MAKIDGVQEVRIIDLVPYERNAKIHSEEQVEKIAASIEEFGFLNPILIDGNKNIIAGHGRVMAAKMLGLEQIPCIYVEGLTEAQRKAYILADNRLTELGEWDTTLISEELNELKTLGFDIDLTGFDVDEIIITDDMAADITEEEIEEIKEAPSRVHQGEVWILGKHRLMCGDSTSSNDCKKLVGGGSVDLLVTDPPYNVAVENTQGMTIANDNMDRESFLEFLNKAFANASEAMRPGASYYVWYASKSAIEFLSALENANLIPRQQLIWVKNNFTLGRQSYQWKHEPCLYGWKEGAPHYFIDMRSLSTVTGDKRPKEYSHEEAIAELEKFEELTTIQYEDKPLIDSDHPTMKPVPLILKQVRNSSREGEVVLDLFGGSGTTLIACEELNRICYMMEYDPKYAEVIIQRWENLTGKKAVLCNDGE